MRSKFIGLLIVSVLAASMLAAFSVPVRAGAITPKLWGYTLTPTPEWTHGDVKGYYEGDWIPFKIEITSDEEGSYNLNVTVHLDYYDGSYYALNDTRNFMMWRNGDHVAPSIAGPSPNEWESGIQQLQFSWNFTINKGDNCTLYFEAHIAEGAHNYPGSKVHVHIHSITSDPSTSISQGHRDVPVTVKVKPAAPPQEYPSINIWKTANTTMAHVGDTIRYYYNVTNTGNVQLTNIRIDDNVTGTIDVTDALDLNHWILVHYDYTVKGTDPDPLINNATVYCDQGVSAWDTWTVDVLHPSIDVIKTANVTMIHGGDWVEYNVTVVNTGDCDLDVTLEDELLGISWTGTLKPGEKHEEIVTIQPTEDPTENTANATGVDPLGKEVSDSASWTVDILHPAINVTKVANVTRAYAGNVIEYTINVTNIGDCPLYNVNVTDTLLLEEPLTIEELGVGEGEIFTLTYTVKVGDPDPLVNTVTVEGEDALGLVVSANATASVDLVAKICGYKFYDANVNGVWDDGEPGVKGIKIRLYYENGTCIETTTDENGYYCFDGLDAGNYTIVEVLEKYWRSTTSKELTVTLRSGEISEGNNFGNTKIITRTQGFWATHYNFTWSTWQGIENKTIGSKEINNTGSLFGAFWSSIPYKSDGKTRRSLLDQARMQLLQQLVAAILNVQAFGDDDLGTGASLVAKGKEAFASDNRTLILSVAKALEEFNSSGDTLPLPEGVYPGPADPKTAQKTADRSFWDTLP
ncbi:MAG: SdrD B-like domain-containing protein [Candidatus Bathyarchaeia archaeon]